MLNMETLEKTVETASNKLFDINWCVILKELLINVGLILPMET